MRQFSRSRRAATALPSRSHRGPRWLRRVLPLAVAAAAAGAVPTRPLRAAVQTPAGNSDSALPASGDTTLAFRGVSVIDVTNGQRLADQTVVIVGSRIQAVGPAGQVAVPQGMRVVDAKGKYLVPGFWDMHAHITGNVEVFDPASDVYPMFIAHGVTGIREMAQRFSGGSDSFRVWQREIRARTRVGPRAVGPSADVSQGSGISIEAPADARRILDSLKAAGDAFVKFHGEPDNRELFFALAREARRVGLPLVGHVPHSVTEVEVSDSGMRSIEHVNEHRQCWPDWPHPLGDSAAVDARCGPIAQVYIRNGTWLTPTLIVDRLPIFDSTLSYSEVLRYVRVMRRLGVTRFLAGSDWAPDLMEADSRFQPGLAAVEELVLLAEAGLTPLEALQAGTLNPAKFFDAADSLGTVAPGKLADLALLDGDPLSNIRNVLKLRAVVANGRYFDRQALDRLHLPGHGMLDDEPTRAGAKAAP